MFAPLAPIRSDSRSGAAIDPVLARIDAIGTVLHALGRIAGQTDAPVPESLNQRAMLSARLAQCDAALLSGVARELDAVAAALQAGFVALDRTRKRGQRAMAAAALLHREASEQLAAVLLDAAGSDRPA